MTSVWVPHGHIRDEDLEEGYQNAIAPEDAYGSSQGPKEYHSIHLVEDLCNSVWFPRPNYKTNSQFPPSDSKGPNKAADLATQSVDDTHKWHLFCFHEGKRVRNTSESKIRALENQAQGYCEEFIKAHPDVSMVYANTFVGGHVRFWSFTRGDSRLRGFWNGDEKDHFEHYKDVGLDENFYDIQQAIDNMKSMPVGSLHRGQSHSQIGASLGKRPATQFHPMTSASSSLTTTLNADPAVSLPLLGTQYHLRDEDYVNVTLVQYGRDLSHHLYRFQTPRGLVEKLGSEFTEGIDPRGSKCMVYYGKLSNICFWTATLDPESEYVAVDLKNKRDR